MANLGFLLFAFCIVKTCVNCVKYTPDWDSLDSRPLPEWFDEAKFGIFIHWGVFSVPSYKTVWFWPDWVWGDKDISAFMKKNYRPDFTYADFAKDFTAEFYDPYEWADIFQAAGAQYIVFVSKHGEGYPNWPSKYSFNWNSKDVGPNKDLVGELAEAIRNKTDIKFGLYYCLSEWLHPLFIEDKKNNFTTDEFVRVKALPMLYELVNAYKPEIVWSDLADGTGPDTYYKSKEFLAWLYNESPVKETVVTNDRWCDKCLCKHGGYLTCRDRYNPGVLQKRKWEDCTTIDTTWDYRRDAKLDDFKTPHSIISILASTISCGGNLLLNVAPTKYGKIIPVFEERLRQVGSWLKVNGEGIYKSKPWTYQKDNMTRDIWYTMKKTENEDTVVYAILLSWPEQSVLKLGAPIPSSITTVTLLGYQKPLTWTTPGDKGIDIAIPTIPFDQMPCQWAWVLKLTHIKN